ncbi:hypothetical protein AB0D49_30010 [Streptomyces sp. NPDC048290]|uniref:hypothetical protein n=1 Tax=Streptomyces sp. NPDC048290 TaxID=3155811 RepID=UPI003436589D
MNAPVLAGRSVRGATALRGGRPWRPTPYQVFGLLCWLVVSLAYWRVPLCCDAGLDAAVVERLAADLLHPRHPVAALPGAGSPYYSPYAVAQGVLARWTGLGGWEVVRLAGPVNLLVLLIGVGRFVRMLTPRPWAPVLALAALTLLWGTGPVPGGPSLALLPLTGGLQDPSVSTLGLTLWAWGLTGVRARDAGRVRFVGPSGLPGPLGYAALGVPYGLVGLIDPVVGVGAGVGALTLIGCGRPRAVPRWGWAAVTATAVIWSWPYYDAFTAGFDHAIGDRSLMSAPAGSLIGACWLALLVGLPMLVVRAGCGSWRDPLVLMAVPGLAVVGYALLDGRPVDGGLLDLALVPPQCAVAVELAVPRPWSVWRRALGVVAVGGMCAGLLMAQGGAVLPGAFDQNRSSRSPYGVSYAWAAQHVGPGDVVLAVGRDTVHGLAGFGVDVVAPAVADPALDEAARDDRLADVRTYLSPGATPAERAAVVRRHRVRWVLLTRWHTVPEGAVVVAWSERTGEVLARVG